MCACGCSSPDSTPATSTIDKDVEFRVGNMTCGHCVATITKAIRAVFPQAKVQAHLASRIVSVAGVWERERLMQVIIAAGYSPAPLA